MSAKCDAEIIFQRLHDLMKKLSDSSLKSTEDKNNLVSLLNQYWDIECPEDNDCAANTCNYAKPIDWVEYHGYTCLADLIDKYDYEEDGIKNLEDHSTIDPLKAHWARRSGHFNP